MKSARINFGIGAESEYVLEVDDTGVAIQCFNPVTGQVLGVGGAGGVLFVDVAFANDGMSASLDKNYSEITEALSNGEYVVFSAINPVTPPGSESYIYGTILNTMTDNSSNFSVGMMFIGDTPLSMTFEASTSTGVLIADLS